MELKRILARDTRAATEQAIKLYGEDVLIVSNHRVGQQIELVVAVDIPSEPLVAAQVAQPTVPASAASAPAQPAGFRGQLDVLLGHACALAPAPAAVAAPVEAVAPAPTGASDDRDRVRSQELVAMVREELADLRREFRLSQRSAALQQGMEWDPAVAPLVERLRDSAMPGGLRTLLLDSLQGHDDVVQACQTLREQLVSAAGSPAAGMPSRGLHVLAGPSGAGKTTMAARLAQWGANEFGADQVALVSFRDLRAGAWSQMQILGAQTGVEVFRAMDAATLALLVSEIGHRALVVIDTPGVQVHEHVRDITAVCPQAQVHAVLAADSSEATCRRLLAQGDGAFAGLMLSKLDEADAPWALLQFLSNVPNPPARSLLSRSDRLNQPVLTWSVEDLVDHALQASGLIPTEDEVLHNPIAVKSSSLLAPNIHG